MTITEPRLLTKAQAVQILRESFAKLTAKQRANVRAHLKKGTRVLCGKNASLFYAPGAG